MYNCPKHLPVYHHLVSWVMTIRISLRPSLASPLGLLHHEHVSLVIEQHGSHDEAHVVPQLRREVFRSGYRDPFRCCHRAGGCREGGREEGQVSIYCVETEWKKRNLGA